MASLGVDDSSNPYRSPQSDGTATWPVPAAPDGQAVATLIRRGWLYRQVRLSGRLEAEIEWNGRWPMEFVRVNGRTVAAKHAFFYVPHFAILLPTTVGPCQMAVDVSLSFYPMVKRFQISLDGQTVYLESG